MTEENIISEVNIKFDENNNPTEEEDTSVGFEEDASDEEDLDEEDLEDDEDEEDLDEEDLEDDDDEDEDDEDDEDDEEDDDEDLSDFSERTFNDSNLILSKSQPSEDDIEYAEDQIKTEDDQPPEDEELSDEEVNFIREFYDEDGEERQIREHLIGDHKIAHSPIYFEDALPEYLMDLIQKRVDEIEEDEWESGSVGNELMGGEDPESRQCNISWIPEIDWVSTIFTHYCHIANREIWEYDLTELESIQVTKYNKNHFYGWHSDYGTSADKDLTRKLSMSIIISDPEAYSGGKLQFLDYMGKVQSVPKEKGTVVVFDSRTPHRVTPVLRGERISLVAWFTGPKLR